MLRKIARCVHTALFLSPAATPNAHNAPATRQPCMLEQKIKLTVYAYQDMELWIIFQVPRAHPVRKARLHQASKMSLAHHAAGGHCH
jgi:hypothetical protein